MKFHDPGNKIQIPFLYVWMSVDKDGNEGIIAHKCGPLVYGYSWEHMHELMKSFAQDAINISKGKYTAKLVKFSNKEFIEEIK